MVKTHATALKQEHDEVATLKTQLAEISESHKTEMENAASERTVLEQEMQKLRESTDAAEKTAESAQQAAQRFQARIDAWTAEFMKVQENMSGKLSLYPSYFCYMMFPNQTICRCSFLDCSELSPLHRSCCHSCSQVLARTEGTSSTFYG